jgi:phospholipid transport system substrate-binding protein
MQLVQVVAAAGVLAGSAAMAADAGTAAQDLVRQVASRIIEELDSESGSLRDNPERAYELAERMVVPHFDVERMARRVLGKRWRAATPEQQTRFVSAFRTMLVRTYALVLHEYRGQTLTYLDPVPRKKDDEIVIPVRIEVAGGKTMRVAYALQGTGSDWKVFDVAVDGVSLVTNYRSSFRSEIARHGIERLIERLESNNARTN